MTSDLVETVATGFSFLESPRWHDGELFASDFYRREVYAFNPDSGTPRVVASVPRQPSGLGWDPQGRLLVVSMEDAALLRLEGDHMETVATFTQFVHGCANDMVVDSAGGAYIGNFGYQPETSGPMVATNLVRVEPHGQVSVAASDLVFPNGVVLTPDEGTLLVAETFAGRVTAFDRSSSGALSNRRVWAQWGTPPVTVGDDSILGLPIYPDGLALDAEGYLWVADAKGHGVRRVREGGESVEFVDTGALSVYACALGAPDRRTLYMCSAPPLGTVDPKITTASQLLRVRVSTPGAGRP